MHYRSLGRSGLQVSAIGLGTNQFGGKVDQAGVNAIVDRAVDLGVNFIDTADVYQQGRSETTLGVALQGKWDKVVLATRPSTPRATAPPARCPRFRRAVAIPTRRPRGPG